MEERRLESLLAQFPNTHVLVLGDFFLDLYLDMDRALSEISLETGLEAYQVVGVRASPGAAGTVTSNLRALDVQVTALGVIGDDGRGYELLRGLRQRGVEVAPLIQIRDRFTPTYTKPMMREVDGRVHELNRLDIKNRSPLPAAVEAQLVSALHALIQEANGIVVADQVQERNCGVITDRVRAALAELSGAYPDKPIVVDSRVRIGEFRGVCVKPNAREAASTLDLRAAQDEPSLDTIQAAGRALQKRNGRPAFVTVGAEGVWVFDEEPEVTHVPGIPVPGPIDVVGAGDSVMAGIVSALCCGASPPEAAAVGNLVASITVQQIGTTGTASREQVLARHRSARTA
jgi:rfaE bifunctional protein kinase chain/domain